MLFISVLQMQFIFYLFAVVAITIGVVLVPVHANVQREVTIPVEAGISECFFQNISAGNVIDIEYQVIDGGHGDADISFVLYDTNGKIISSDYKKSDNIHRHEALLDGDYRFCFDNSFSMFNTKTVFFEIIVETDESGAPTADAWGPEILDGLSPEEFVDLKVGYTKFESNQEFLIIVLLLLLSMSKIVDSGYPGIHHTCTSQFESCQTSAGYSSFSRGTRSQYGGGE